MGLTPTTLASEFLKINHMKKLLKQGQLLYSKRDEYGLIQVIETAYSRCLYFNTPVEQSHFLIHAPFQLELDYQAKMTELALDFCLNNPNTHLLSLGVGGGLMNRYLYDILPNLQQTLVELRAIVLQAAQTYFYLPRAANIYPVVANAIDYIQDTSTQFDLILIDLYDEQGMPPDCTTPKFLTHILNHLKRPGLAIFNLWEDDQEALNALLEFWQQQIQENTNIEQQSYLIPSSGNIILCIQTK